MNVVVGFEIGNLLGKEIELIVRLGKLGINIGDALCELVDLGFGFFVLCDHRFQLVEQLLLFRITLFDPAQTDPL